MSVGIAFGYKKILPMTALSVNGLLPARVYVFHMCRLMITLKN